MNEELKEILNESDRRDPEEASIEEMLARLEEIAQNLQDSSSPLETAFNGYREGMDLIRACTEKIDLIEKEVQILGGEETIDEL